MLKSYLRGLPPHEREEAIADLVFEIPKNPEWAPYNYDEWLHDWVEIYFNIDIPQVQVCEDHTAPFRAFADAFFARYPIALWLGSRGLSGKTMQLATLSAAEATLLGSHVNLLGGSGEQSQNVNEYLNGTNPRVKNALFDGPYCPDIVKSAFSKVTELRTGGRIKALMASRRSVRGPHVPRLRLDEIDEMEREIFDDSRGQTMSMEDIGLFSQTVCSSTHQHPDGTVTYAKKLAKQKGWPIIMWCYRESMKPHGWLSEREKERKRTEVTSEKWENEYELSEPSVEGRVFTTEQLNFLFDRRLGEFKGEEGEMCRIERPQGHAYATGADWAKQKDWTIIDTVKEVVGGPDIVVAWMRMGRRKWPTMVGAFNKRVMDYGGTAWHDATGVGDVVSDYLTVDSTGFNFSAHTEAREILNAYVGAVQNLEYKGPFIEHAYNEHKFLTQEMIDGKKHRPDSIIAAALRHRAKTSGVPEFLMGRA